MHITSSGLILSPESYPCSYGGSLSRWSLGTARRQLKGSKTLSLLLCCSKSCWSSSATWRCDCFLSLALGSLALVLKKRFVLQETTCGDVWGRASSWVGWEGERSQANFGCGSWLPAVLFWFGRGSNCLGSCREWCLSCQLTPSFLWVFEKKSSLRWGSPEGKERKKNTSAALFLLRWNRPPWYHSRRLSLMWLSGRSERGSSWFVVMKTQFWRMVRPVVWSSRQSTFWLMRWWLGLLGVGFLERSWFFWRWKTLIWT